MRSKNKSFRQIIYVIGPSIAYIPLTKGMFSLIDSDVPKEISDISWSVSNRGIGRDYLCVVGNKRVENKFKGVILARELLGLTSPRVFADHKNRNPLDNRLSNLRPCDVGLNNRNSKTRKDCKCGIKGVDVLPSGRFRAGISDNGRRRHIGVFDTAEEANSAYLSEAKKLAGEFACSGI